MATSSPSGLDSACDLAHAAKQASKASASIRPKTRLYARMGGNAIVQLQKLGEPGPFALPVERDVLVALSTGDRRADGNYQAIGERIYDFPAFPQAGEVGKKWSASTPVGRVRRNKRKTGRRPIKGRRIPLPSH